MVHNASHRFARIAPRKARLVSDMVRGLPVDEALTALDFSKVFLQLQALAEHRHFHGTGFL